ncbi:hypothetical protein ACIBI4_09755 [Streptomyces sp. NPDC050418]|uniref:hypothetical protein n=1 Tax=Streptomyces sp. NPDC050418 TaxID=3365612 RepID=UPI003792BCC0
MTEPSSSSAALFSLVWSLGALSFGLIIATNFRGSATRFHAMSQRSTYFGRRSRFTGGVGFLRLLAGAFCLIAPFILINAVKDLLEGVGGAYRMPYLPAPMLMFMFGIGAFGMWMMWRPDGPLRREWQAGATLQRTAATLATAAAAAFYLSLALGSLHAMLAVWAIGGAAGLTLLVTGRADHEGRG